MGESKGNERVIDTLFEDSEEEENTQEVDDGFEDDEEADKELKNEEEDEWSGEIEATGR